MRNLGPIQIRSALLAVGAIFLMNAATPQQIGRADAIRISSLRTEYFDHPLGIDVIHPRLSWQLRSSAHGVAQSAYEIQVARSEPDLRNSREIVWDSGKVMSDVSILRPYEGPTLESRRQYFWRVRVWDGQDRDLGWSDISQWEMGLLSEKDWSAHWISGPASVTDSADPMLRHEFTLNRTVKAARVYVTSRGLYQLFINGQRVGSDVLTPGWTSYAHRLQYQSYDVSTQVKSGTNVIGAFLGKGWFSGVVGYEGKANHYGDKLALLAQLEVTFDDGSHQTIVSDETWKSAASPILMSELYDGETYDARLEKKDWAAAGFDDSDWATVQSIAGGIEGLVAPEGFPVREIEMLAPKRIFKTPSGDTVVDFGQNMVGWVRLKVRGRAGNTVTLRHAEVLDSDRNFYTKNLRSAKAIIRYTLNGRGEEIFEPHFTFQGFRYVAVEGYPGTLNRSSLTGVVVHSAMPTMSEFATSKPLINQLQHNITWGQKGNFLDVPTDCPQRDERLGWTGDAQVFSATAAFNMDVGGFFSKWLKDLALDQLPNGGVPFVIPDVLSTSEKPAAGAAGWGDAATVIPWNMYLAYGDLRILERQYPSMQKWVEYEQSRAGADEIWDGDFHFGDWLDFFGAAKRTSFGATSTDLIATAYFAHSTDILSRSAKLLGKSTDAAKYSALLVKIKNAFTKKFINDDGAIAEGTQTAYVIALDFDLVPQALQRLSAEKLANDVRERGHLTTGFLGTPHLLQTLSRFGYLEEAYALLNRETFPSWLYPVKQGATTIWERWDGRKPDGSFENEAMNSFNHYAYGAVGEWMYTVIGGINIDPDAPGYKHIVIQPQPGGGFTHAKASHQSPYGEVKSQWQLRGRQLEFAVVVPPNTTATVLLPGAHLTAVTESGKPLREVSGINAVRQDGSRTALEVSSGRYQFKYPYTNGTNPPPSR